MALDLVIGIDNGHLFTTIHHKPNDRQQYVHWTSDHPRHLLKSIPKAQFMRLKRNCSRNSDYESEARTLKDKFLLRGYPVDILERALATTERRTRASLLTPQERSRQDRICLATMTTNRNQQTKQATSSFYQLLLAHPLCTERTHTLGTQPLPGGTPLVAFKVGRNLGATLGKIYKT